MYVVFKSDRNNPIACHDELDVVTTYVDNIKKFHEEYGRDLFIKKIKYKRLGDYFKDNEIEDKYLVKYGDTYIQTEFYDALDYVSRQDNKYAQEVLYRLLETEKLSKREFKYVSKVVEILDRYVEDDNIYTPTVQECRQIEYDIEKYQYMMHNT